MCGFSARVFFARFFLFFFCRPSVSPSLCTGRSWALLTFALAPALSISRPAQHFGVETLLFLRRASLQTHLNTFSGGVLLLGGYLRFSPDALKRVFRGGVLLEAYLSSGAFMHVSEGGVLLIVVHSPSRCIYARSRERRFPFIVGMHLS